MEAQDGNFDGDQWIDYSLSPKDQDDQQRCSRLFAEAGLSDVTKLVKVWSCKDEHGYSYSRADQGYVVISLSEMDETISQLSTNSPVQEIEAFIALVMHEIGHVVAHARGLDCTDEKLAWEIAEELLPIPKPRSWDTSNR